MRVEHLTVAGTFHCDDAGLGGQFEHLHAVQLASGLDLDAADHERPLTHRECSENLEPHCRADEPRCRQIDCGADVLEAEPVAHRIAQFAVEDPHDDRDALTVR